MSKSYLISRPSSPYHLSIGAVLINEKSEICCHYFKEIQGQKDIYILMRETIITKENIEDCLHRGLIEEFGATGKILGFLGNTTTFFEIEKVEVEKTTLYFLCNLIDQDLNLRSNEDIEFNSEVRWININEIIEIFSNLKIKPDQDELKILKRAKKFIEENKES